MLVRCIDLSLPVEADRLADEAAEANWMFELNVPAERKSQFFLTSYAKQTRLPVS